MLCTKDVKKEIKETKNFALSEIKINYRKIFSFKIKLHN